jgi:hypothetical protein
MSSDDIDDDDIEYYADLWGVSDEQAEVYLDAIAEFEEETEYDYHPDPDYMQYLADIFDIDVSDLYDMYYGYNPGE